MAGLLMLVGCDKDQYTAALTASETEDAGVEQISAIPFTPKVVDGMIAFADLEEFMEVSGTLSNYGHGSYMQWLSERGVETLYGQSALAEEDLLAGRATATQITAGDSNLEASEDGLVYPRNFPYHTSKLLSPEGLMVVGTNVIYVGELLQVSAPVSLKQEMLEAIGRGGKISDDRFSVAHDKRYEVAQRDVSVSLACGPNSWSDWVHDPGKFENGSNRWLDGRYSFVTIPNSVGTNTWEVITYLDHSSESFRGNNGNDRYPTVHDFQLIGSIARRDNDPNSTVGLVWSVSSGGETKSWTSRLPLGRFYPVIASNASNAVYTFGMMITSITSGANNTPLESGGSIATHRGMGVGNYYRFRCN